MQWATTKLLWAAVVVLIALTVRCFLLESLRVTSSAMAPSLESGDYVFITKFDYSLRLPFSTYEIVRFRIPQRNELVAYSLADASSDTYIGRVIAISGDRLAIINSSIVLNGRTAHYRDVGGGSPDSFEEMVNESTVRIRLPSHPIKDFGPIDVPVNHFFALTDNREEVMDSRLWGPIPYSCLKGRVARKVRPF